MQSIRILFLFLIGTLAFTPSAEAQLFKKKKKKAKTEKPAKKKGKIKPYHKVITAEAKTDSGFFHVHHLDGNYYFELPKALLEKEILVTSRVAGFVKNLNFGGAGIKSQPQQVIRWQQKDDKILLRRVSYNSVASFEDPIYQSVKNNNFEPIIMAFDVQAYAKDSSSVVIKVDPLFTKDVQMLSAVNSSQRRQFGIRGVDGQRSFINQIKSFPENVEVRHVLTYTGNKLPDNASTGAMSIEMNQSFILLPEVPMVPRAFDARVGYFSVGQTDYSADEQKAFDKRFINRWRLEPKPEDRDAYFRGELVEPAKPIVYYIDPATPLKWRPYLKQGVNDWVKSFEKAGFKNAIMAKDAPSPEEDPDWSPEDIRYSTIRYVSTDIQNAMGPHVHDPRTGEILESDIIWYHNVMNLLRNWFFVQTAAINPDARSPKFKDEIMGQLIRFVAAHEVGHTLGLPHNMGSSVAYSVDSLRSPSFTKKMGTAPSIMDYARFNYVAQPEDGDINVMPAIGPYDDWSIEFGYRLFEGIETPEQEREILNRMIIAKDGQPIYRFGQQRGLPLDPSAQTEDLGDNSMRASELGIKNLQRVVPKLIEWTGEDTKDFSELSEIYNNVFGQFGRYMGHVGANVGGVYENFKTYDQDQPVYVHVEKAKQKDAIDFLNKQLFTTPLWLLDNEIISRIEPGGAAERIRGLQDRSIALLLNPVRLKRMTDNEILNGQNAYSPIEMLDDLSNGIFRELKSGEEIDIYRRNLQRTFVEGLERVLDQERNQFEHSDSKAIARGVLMDIKSRLSSARSTDRISKYHIADLKANIDKILKED